MRTDLLRIAKYNAKTVAATVGLKIGAQLPTMPDNYTAFVNVFAAMQLLVNSVLATEGVRPIQAGMYQAFAAKVWKLQNSTSDPTLTNVTTDYGKQFAARGCVKATLVKIADIVFGLTIVIP
jgi:hypothetical protein